MSLYVDVFVAAVFSHQWYIGKVTNKDDVEQEVQMNVMTKSGKYGETCGNLNVYFLIVLCRFQIC